MKTPLFENGDEVKCKITGLKGIIVAITVWFNGCIRYVVQPQIVKDGKPVETSSLDENELTLVKSHRIQAEPVRRTGGPQRGEKVSSRKY